MFQGDKAGRRMAPPKNIEKSGGRAGLGAISWEAKLGTTLNIPGMKD